MTVIPSTAEVPFVQVSDLHCTLGGTPVLNGVSFNVDRGDYLSIVGPNGAGKSTLLKCLNRILTQWRGDVRVDGRSLGDCSQRDVARIFAYVPQFNGGELPHRVDEFVLMSRFASQSLFGGPGDRDREIVREALALTETLPLAARRMATLSGGECQKVFIAAALAQQTDTMLLDEPSTFLDPRYQHEVAALLKQLNRERGVTILAVSHDLNSAALCSHRVLALKDGRVVYHGAPAGFMRPEQLTDVFDTEFVFASHPHVDTPIVVPTP